MAAVPVEGMPIHVQRGLVASETSVTLLPATVTKLPLWVTTPAATVTVMFAAE
jgi:hypothetical protein